MLQTWSAAGALARSAAGAQTVIYFSKKTFFFVLLHRVPIATGTMNIFCCRRGALQAHLGLTFPSTGYKIQQNSKKPFFF